MSMKSLNRDGVRLWPQLRKETRVLCACRLCFAPMIALGVSGGVLAVPGGCNAGQPESHTAPTVQITVEELAAAMHNHDIEWNCGIFGMLPLRVRGATLLLGVHFKRTAIPCLVAALNDPDRCGAAHFLLGRLLLRRVQGGIKWDGLDFDRAMTPIVDLPARTLLKAVWKKRLARLAFIESIPP
jgi:hypothetical protein